MFKKVLNFIVRLLPFVLRAYPKTKCLFDALKEVDKRSPIKKRKSWRDKL